MSRTSDSFVIGVSALDSITTCLDGQADATRMGGVIGDRRARRGNHRVERRSVRRPSPTAARLKPDQAIVEGVCSIRQPVRVREKASVTVWVTDERRRYRRR